MKKTITILTVILFSLALFSCAGGVKQQKGTGIGSAIGAGLGAIVGQAIGSDTESTLLGAGIGAVVGGIAGNQVGAYMDRQEKALRDALATSEAASVQRVKQARAEAEEAGQQRELDLLTATFKSEVLFDFDSATLKPGGYAELAKVAEVLKNYPQTGIRVVGHTDTTGSEEYNLDLSERRAEAVKSALVQLGVNEARIESIGMGESQPVSSDDAMNRRVVIVIIPVVKSAG